MIEGSSWNDIELPPPLMKAIHELGFERPSEIQEVAIPVIAGGRNVICDAPSGTGKTAAYAIGILAKVNPENNVPQVLILAHTRELAQQVASVVSYLGKCLNIVITMLKQDWTGTAGHVLVGTTEATLGIFRRKETKVDQIRCLVLDDADALLNQPDNPIRNMYFHQVDLVCEYLPTDLQFILVAKKRTKKKHYEKALRRSITKAKKIRVESRKPICDEDEEGKKGKIMSTNVPLAGETHREPGSSGVTSQLSLPETRGAFINSFDHKDERDLYRPGRDLKELQYQQAAQLRLRALQDMKAHEKGVAEATHSLGMRYFDGKGVKQDMEKAADLFRQAHERLADATYWLGMMYRDGKGVKQDMEKAADLFRQAHEKGDADATYNLGHLYRDGKGVKQDTEKAADLFRQAHEKGVAEATYMYCQGEGVGQDMKEAADLFRQAHEKGHAEAMRRLRMMYMKGKGKGMLYDKGKGMMHDQGKGKAQEYQRQHLWQQQQQQQQHVAVWLQASQLQQRMQGAAQQPAQGNAQQPAPQPYPVSAIREDAEQFIPEAMMQRTQVASSTTPTFEAELHPPVTYSEDAVVHSRLCQALGFPECLQDEPMKPMSGLIEAMQRVLDESASSESKREYQRKPRRRPKVVAVYQNCNKEVFKSFVRSLAQMEESVRNGKRIEALNPPIEDSVLEACPFEGGDFLQRLNCVFAFHGVQWSKCDDVLRDGFDEGLASENALYGCMCYFSPQSNKAMQYARADDCSVRKSRCGKHKPLLFCQCSKATTSDDKIRQRLIYGPVLLGNPYYAKGVTETSGGKTAWWKTEECRLRKPPEGYDSIVAKPGIWRSNDAQQVHYEYVLRNHNGACAYPAYVVEVEYSRA